MAVDIKRALTDKKYLDSLNDDEVRELLEKAAGSGELSEEELEQASGGIINSDTKVIGGGSCATTGGSCLACKRSKITHTC